MHGIEQIRTLFPRAKFIFHWRRNTSRIAASDFWQLERQSAVARRNFERLVGRFRKYAAAHPDYQAPLELHRNSGTSTLQ